MVGWVKGKDRKEPGVVRLRERVWSFVREGFVTVVWDEG